MKLWIVSYVDYGENCDGKARVLGVYKTKEHAINELKLDITDYSKNYTSNTLRINYDTMCVYDDCDSDVRCEWNLEEKELMED